MPDDEIRTVPEPVRLSQVPELEPDAPAAIPAPLVDVVAALAGNPPAHVSWPEWSAKVHEVADYIHRCGWMAGFHAGRLDQSPMVMFVTGPEQLGRRAQIPAQVSPEAPPAGPAQHRRVVPRPHGFADRDAGNVFLMLAEQLLVRGMSPDQANRFVDRALEAARAELSRPAA
jgi:hypothetical protein